MKTIGTTIAAVLWHAMGEEQRTQIKTIATNMITDLSTQLANALSTLSAQAYQIGGELLNGITSKFGEIFAEDQTAWWLPQLNVPGCKRPVEIRCYCN